MASAPFASNEKMENEHLSVYMNFTRFFSFYLLFCSSFESVCNVRMFTGNWLVQVEQVDYDML